MMHSIFGHQGRTDIAVIQTHSFGCVFWWRAVSWPEQSSLSLYVFCGNTQGLGGLITWLLGIQRVLREQDTDSWDRPLHGDTRCFLLRILPDLIHCLVVELGHLVESSNSTFQNFHACDGLGDSSAWASEDHLSQRGRIAISRFALHACCCKPQQITDFASFFHSHVQDVCCQAGDGKGTAVLCAADSFQVALVKFWRQRWR